MSSRIALVTGGNRGIGLAVALALQEAGHQVVVTCRESPPPDGLRAVRCDVRDDAEVDAAIEEVERSLGPVGILVGNAGMTDDRLLATMPEESFASVLDVNLTGTYRAARRVMRGMMRARYGRLVFVSSVVAMQGSAGQSNYAAAKAGLIGFARSLGREVGQRGITVNVVAPGFIETDMTAALPSAVRSQALAAIPSRRFGSPQDVAAVVRFLVGDEAGYLTGAVIPVDGGLGMGH